MTPYDRVGHLARFDLEQGRAGMGMIRQRFTRRHCEPVETQRLSRRVHREPFRDRGIGDLIFRTLGSSRLANHLGAASHLPTYPDHTQSRDRRDGSTASDPGFACIHVGLPLLRSTRGSSKLDVDNR